MLADKNLKQIYENLEDQKKCKLIETRFKI